MAVHFFKKKIELPLIGLGTWELRGEECAKVVKEAVELGYQHIDTAFAYENHRQIKKALKGFDRNKFYITSKIALETQVDPAKQYCGRLGFAGFDSARQSQIEAKRSERVRPLLNSKASEEDRFGKVEASQIPRNLTARSIEQSVQKACDSALDELGTDYLDLYLIHSPFQDFPLEKIFAALEGLVKRGKILRAGVSNFTIHHLEDLRRAGFTPFANQVEFHPYLYQKELWEYCKSHGIKLISYRTLRQRKVVKGAASF